MIAVINSAFYENQGVKLSLTVLLVFMVMVVTEKKTLFKKIDKFTFNIFL